MLYVLAVVLRIGAHEAIIQPQFIYEDYSACIVDRDYLQPLTSVKLNCMELERGV